MSQDDSAVPIRDIIKELLRIAREIDSEEWADEDAQTWYLSGIKDSAHLLMLKWKD